jgi:hypothetical protein
MRILALSAAVVMGTAIAPAFAYTPANRGVTIQEPTTRPATQGKSEFEKCLARARNHRAQTRCALRHQ